MADEKNQEERLPAQKRQGGTIWHSVTLVATTVLAVCVCVCVLGTLAMSSGAQSGKTSTNVADVTIMDKFDMFVTNQISNALDGVLSIKKVYWLSDTDEVAPEPNADCYGVADSPEELQELLEKASGLIGDQEMLFGMDTPVWEKDRIYYYYDETILVITWKQVIDYCVHTISEVIVAHPSQFRRGLAGGEFGSDKQFVTTQMAQNVNAVVATSGDFYKFRRVGAIAYQGQLRRFDGASVDTCFINEDGDLLFAYRGDLKSEEEAEKFIEDNHVRFSLAFGPILVDDGKNVTPDTYPLGEINDVYSRAAVCQMGQLHYLFVNSTGEPKKGIVNRQTVRDFAEHLVQFGCEKAYALDGGQTTVIAMDGELISFPDYGTQRQISDILYFATALPDGG